jgi:K+-sensing histidine kinase KdpD
MQDTHPVPSKLRALSHYGFAIAVVSLALFLSLVLQVPFGDPFWFFFPVAVIASTWYGGKGPGWVAVGFSTLTVLYFFIPPVRTWILKPSEVPFFLTFVSCQVAASLLSSWRRQTEDSLRNARDELEVKVGERTAELKNANETLLNQIAEQRRTEESLEITRTELARVARITTIGELTASIAHEVNQPLAAVVSNADACVAWLSHQIQIFAKRARRPSAPFTARHAHPRSSPKSVRLSTRPLRRESEFTSMKSSRTLSR